MTYTNKNDLEKKLAITYFNRKKNYFKKKMFVGLKGIECWTGNIFFT